MKINEIISKSSKKIQLDEKINDEIFNSNKSFKQRVKIGNYVYKAENTFKNDWDEDIPGLNITVTDPKLPKGEQIIAYAHFIANTDGENSWLESDETLVENEYQGQGIAYAMYAYAKSLGNDIRPSSYQTMSGEKMWAKWGDDANNLIGESSSGYIPSNAEKDDPRFKTALTVDIKPDSIQQNAKKLGLGNIRRSGIPQAARADGKVKKRKQ